MINSSFDTKTGRISFEFDDGGSVSTAQILSVGSLNYEYDQTPDSTTIDRTMAVYSFIQVSMMQYDDIGEDLWERLTAATLVQEVAVLMNIATWDNESYDFPMKIRITDISLNERNRNITLRLLPNTNLTVTAGEVFDEMRARNNTSIDFKRKIIGSVQQTVYEDLGFAVEDWISSGLNLVFNNTMSNEIASAPSNLPDLYTQTLFGDLPADTKRGLLMLDMRVPYFGSDIGASENITGIGTISTDGEEYTRDGAPIDPDDPDSSEGSIIKITLTSGSTTQFELADQIVADFDKYPLGLGVVKKNSDTEIYYDAVSLKAYTGSPFLIQRPKTPQFIPAIQTLKSLAGVEGAVFGTGFGKNFYFNRINQTDSTVTINYELVTEMKPMVFYLSLGNSLVRQIATSNRIGTEVYGQWSTLAPSAGSRVPNLNDFSSVTAGNRNASKEIKIEIAPGYPFLVKGERVGTYIDGDYPNIETDNQLESSMKN